MKLCTMDCVGHDVFGICVVLGNSVPPFICGVIVIFGVKICFVSKCLLRHYVVRVFVSFCVLVFVRAILSWCP